MVAKARTRAPAKKPPTKTKIQWPEYSISELATLTKLDRGTLRQRLKDLPSKQGPKGAKVYSLKRALPILVSGDSPQLDEAKLKKAWAEAHMKELELDREREDLSPTKEVRDYLIDLFKRMHDRLGKRLPREIAGQVFKCESSAQVTDVLRIAIGQVFNDIRSDHKRFL